MRPAPRSRSVVALLLLLLAGTSAPAARALLNLDGSRNQVFVFGSLAYGYSSNIYAVADGPGDTTYTAQVGVELKRNAGIIAVDAVAKVDFVVYQRYSGENATNPNLRLQLTKSEGRTTGSFTLQAYRESRADAAVNLRTSSWNVPLTLNVRYPIDDKFYLTSTTGYVRRSYAEDAAFALVDYTEFSEGVDVFYTYSPKLDLLAGYRWRLSHTALNDRTFDHWFSVGATGAIFSKMTGTVRVGYQMRDVRRSADGEFDHFNAVASLNWPLTRKLMFSFQVSRDFNTVATGASVDTTTVGVRAQYAFSRRLDFDGGLAWGRNRFLGLASAGRHDTFFTWDVGAHYRLNEHFELGGSYTYLHNWSSLDVADFESHGISVFVSARY